jgi:hypothetical protein
MAGIDARLAWLDGENRIPELNRGNTFRAYFSEMSGFVPALPNLTFNRNLRLHCGDVTIELLFLGRGKRPETT